MKTKKNHLLLLGTQLLLLGAFTVGCKKDKQHAKDPNHNDDHDVTTTLEVTFQKSGEPTFKVKFKDIDGPGGNPPTADTIKLKATSEYLVSLAVLNESVNPTEDLTPEIINEKDDHLFVFKHEGINITTTIVDKDSKNLPFGLFSRWETKETGTGTSTITLKHQPGIKDGQANKGETDMEAVFPIRIIN